jgi:dynein light chain 1
LEDIAGSLEELWVSYNQINSLDGLQTCTNLTTLYISNNLIKAWTELDKLVRSSLSLPLFGFIT